MVGFHLGTCRVGVADHVLDQPQRRLRREHVGAARKILLDQVVLDRSRELAHIRTLLFGDGDIERQQPRRGGVDRHRGVHLLERNAVEQRTHVPHMGDRYADLAHFAARKDVIGVVSRLRRKIEGDGEPSLSRAEIFSIERVGGFSRGMAGIGPYQPRTVAIGHDGRPPRSCVVRGDAPRMTCVSVSPVRQ